jgi:hypothetical protein
LLGFSGKQSNRRHTHTHTDFFWELAHVIMELKSHGMLPEAKEPRTQAEGWELGDVEAGVRPGVRGLRARNSVV